MYLWTKKFPRASYSRAMPARGIVFPQYSAALAPAPARHHGIPVAGAHIERARSLSLSPRFISMNLTHENIFCVVYVVCMCVFLSVYLPLSACLSSLSLTQWATVQRLAQQRSLPS